MKDLYKAIDNLNGILAEESEVQLDEKLKPFTGSYNKKTQKLVNFTMKNGERKTFVAPIDYQKPLSKTNPSAKPFINFLNNLGKKVSDKGKELDPFFKEPKQNTKVDKKEPVTKIGAPISKVTKKELPPMDIMGAGTKRKDAQSDSQKKTKTGGRTTYNTLARLSGIKNPDKIKIGQTIKLPDGSTTKVKKGQTLSGIAQDYRQGKIGMQDTPPKTPKSGGPDKRFITGPELDLPNMKPNNPMAPPQKKISQKNSPGNPFSPDKKIKPQIDRRLTPDLNRYVADKSGNYKPISPNVLPKPPKPGDKKFGDDFVNAIKNYKLGDLSRGIRDFAGNLNKNRIKNRDVVKKMDKGINPNKIDTKIASKKMPDMSSKQPTKTMIEQITGKRHAYSNNAKTK